MWQFFDTKALFVPGNSVLFDWIPFSVENWRFPGEIISHYHPDTHWEGYDAWGQNFPTDSELSLVKKCIQNAQCNPDYRGHIRGISLAESVEMLRDYYRTEGYEDTLAKNYTIPATAQVTASISLRHTLWCEKDKRFLETQDSYQKPYGMLCPPLRGSHDLRILQQALRMNIILGIEVFPGDEHLIDRLVEQEILPPFSVSQMIRFRWEKHVLIEEK